MAESKRFLLRLDPGLFEALRRWADEDLRSINAQIEYLLTDQARRAGRLPSKRSRGSRPSEADVAASEELLAELEETQAPKGSQRARTSARP
jgi:hypothetical protein